MSNLAVPRGLQPNLSSQVHCAIVLPDLATLIARLWRNPVGWTVIAAFAIRFAGFVGGLVISDASRSLLNDVTLYRVLLQLSSIAFSAAEIGAGLFWQPSGAASKNSPVSESR